MKNKRVLMVGTHITTMGGIASVIRDYIDYGTFERLNIDYLATHRDGTKAEKALFYLIQLVKYVVKVPSYSVVHLHTSQGWSFRRLFVVFVLARLMRKKTVLHVHGSDYDIYFEESNDIEKLAIKYALRKADFVISLSSTWDGKLRAIEPDMNSVVIQNTVNVDKYAVKHRVRHWPIRVLFLGRLGKRKGVYDILDALGYMDQSGFSIVLAGDGEIDRVKKIVQEQGMEECVVVPGWVGVDEKQRLLRESDIYILPSYNEGLPVGVLEAIASGLPVITTPVGGIPDAVIDGYNGYLVEPGDFHALADKLTRLSGDSDLWERMGKSSSRLAMDNFSMEMAESKLQQIYATL